MLTLQQPKVQFRTEGNIQMGFPYGPSVGGPSTYGPEKNLPAMQETQVQSLGHEDSVEQEMATYSGLLAWNIPWTEEAGGLQSMGPQRVGHD